MQKKYLECGKIVSTHGIQGEVNVQPWCDSAEYLCDFKTLYLQNGEKSLAVLSARVHKNMALIKFAGISDLDTAVTLRGKVLYIDRDDAKDDGKYFIQDIIGLSVIDADSGHTLGILKDVFSTGANDVYALEDESGKQRLFPAIPEVIIETDIGGGIMKIRPLKGLFDDEN